MAMIRKQVYIALQQDKMLNRLARQTNKTEAEFIRDAIDEHTRSLTDRERRMKAWRAIEATIEQRMKLPAVEAARSWKREDLYDRDRRAHSDRH
jgi:predicted DNA-binding protein